MVIGVILALAATTSIPPSVTIPDLVEVTDITGLAVSPDSRQIAFKTETPSVGSNSYRLEWYVAPVDGKTPPRPVSDGGGALLGQAGAISAEPPIWSPTSNAIYFRALVDGAVQVWRAAADGSGSKPVTNSPANVRDLAVAPGGHGLLFHVGASRDAILAAERQAHDDGTLIDASVYFSQPLTQGGVIDGRLGSQRLTGDWFDRDNILWKTPLQAVQLPFVAGDDRPSAQGSEQTLPASTATIETEGAQDYATAIVAGRKIRCTAPLCLSERPTSIVPLADDGAYLVTLDDSALNQTLVTWRPTDQTLRTIATAKGLLSGSRSRAEPCAVAPNTLLCVASSAAEPPALIKVEMSTGAIVPMFDPNANLRRQTSGTARAIRWQDKAGTPFNGYLFTPRTPKPASGYPIVIGYYRCEGFLRGGVGDELPFLPLAEAGVATLCINMAHTSDVTQMPYHDYALALSGITSVIDVLAGDGTANRRLVGYWGLSFGSEVALQLAMRTKLLAAASIGSGTVDPMMWWMNGMPGSQFPSVAGPVWQFQDPDRDRASWQRFSPALNIAAMAAPMLIQASEQEARPSMEYLTDAARANHPIEMWAYADEAHIKSQPRHKLATYQRNYDWFRYWLQGFQDPASDKADQYRRWATLRQQRDALTKTADRAHP